MPAADIIITNARILTIDGARPRAEALAISGSRLLAVGARDDMAGLRASHTRVIDAKGKTVLPGIIESHMHIFPGSVELDSLMVTGLEGIEPLTSAVRSYSAARPEDKLVVANGANYMAIRSSGVITRQDLDHILPDRPFILCCFDHHTVWANTAALRAAGLLSGRELPPGNEIVMGPDGLATGELKEMAAFAPVFALTPTQGRESLGLTTGEDPVPPATAAQRQIDMAALRRGLAYCASLGITSIHNMDGNFYQLELLDRLRKDGDLTCRVQVPWHQKNYFAPERVDEAIEMRWRYNDDMLYSGRVKIFMDGVLESMTALMLDDYPNHPGERGQPLFTAEQFNDVATRADKHGLQISVHAIGDGAVRRTLDGYEAARKANGKRDSRHRIEHIEVIAPADIPRFKELGVTASMQPIVGLGVPGGLIEPCRERIGRKLPFAYAWQTMREAGAHMSFSSDWPVSPLDPFLGMQSAMTQVPLAPDCPPQAQGLMEAIAAFTSDGAYAEFAEGKKGRLKTGLLADVVVLDGDIKVTPPSELSSIKPAVTICDGRITFTA
ncbi:amidohydrolase [Taklimakanibacter lacteus]|uniref:amidohydrolase n=1 Tax=Taklimakanibacter lacteus TaxID=2268456 RepID=UPI000E674F58